MPILIDGHNLIGHLPGISLADVDDEDALVRLLIAFRARTGKAIAVVFDPGVSSTLGQSRKIGGVQVISASYGSSADAIILRRPGVPLQPFLLFFPYSFSPVFLLENSLLFPVNYTT